MNPVTAASLPPIPGKVDASTVEVNPGKLTSAESNDSLNYSEVASTNGYITGQSVTDSPRLGPTQTATVGEQTLDGAGGSTTHTSTQSSPLPACARIVDCGEFEPEAHFYPRCLNAQIHPLVSSFFSLGNERIIARYVHLNPQVNEDKLREILNYRPQYFAWAGCDLFNVADANGHRQMIVIETNSCPSGQKSMPLIQDNDEYGGYGIVMEHTFKDILSAADPSLGGLAVVYDKNKMEASGYAAVMADLMKERVFLTEYHITDADPPVKWVDRLMHVRDENGDWHPIRACFRYVTQKPWNRFPLYTRTIVLNSSISCLSGGRNKMTAARAYEFFNAELASENAGLEIRVPETIRNVSKSEIPLWVETMGGHAVIKVPYSNAGQGVYTITNQEELNDFMAIPHHYDKFIVQSLVGNASWSSLTRTGRFYHVGTIPNKKAQTFVSDLRMMIAGSTKGNGFRPVAIYARKARKPLLKNLSDDPEISSWEMLGTNLSVKLSEDGAAGGHAQWTTETQRLLLMDRKDFNTLGIGIDDMIDAYVQTVLSVIAIDKMCVKLMPEREVRTTLTRPIGTPVEEEARVTALHSDQIVKSYGRRNSTPTVAMVDQFIGKDGRTYIKEHVVKKERKFNFELFRALNPDEALLSEIKI